MHYKDKNYHMKELFKGCSIINVYKLNLFNTITTTITSTAATTAITAFAITSTTVTAYLSGLILDAFA